MFKKIGIVLIAVLFCTQLFAIFSHNNKANHSDYRVELPANPTTGYSWFLSSYDSNLVRVQSHRYMAPKKGLVGAGGTEVWIFSPTRLARHAPHIVPVTFVYARAWEVQKGEMSGIKTKTVSLVIR